MLNRLSWTVLASVSIAAAGCYNSVRPPIEPRQDVYYHPGSSAQIYFDSTDLRRDTAADTPSVIRDQNGLLHVTVPIRSVINKQLYVEYRVVFFDREGQEIDRSPWQDKTLPANIPESVTIVSTSPKAEAFQMHLRYPISTEY